MPLTALDPASALLAVDLRKDPIGHLPALSAVVQRSRAVANTDMEALLDGRGRA